MMAAVAKPSFWSLDDEVMADCQTSQASISSLADLLTRDLASAENTSALVQRFGSPRMERSHIS
jgi:hypothetical protein